MNDQDRAAQVWDKANVEYNKYIGQARRRNATTIIAAYGQEREHAGVKKMLDVAILCNDNRRFSGAVLSAQEYEKWLDGELEIMANRLLAEQEKKV